MTKRPHDGRDDPPFEPNTAHHLAVEDVAAALGTDPDRGLTQSEATHRLERFGPNELTTEPPVPRWRRFALQFQNPLVILLLVATAVSAGLWAYERDAALPYEALAIFAVVVLNAVMGYIQESRAEAAVAALRAMSAAETTVVRDGTHRTVAAADLVPGDVMLIEEGDTIAADGRLVESASLQTAEASLTGESQPVAKSSEPVADNTPLGDRTSMVYSGTAATYGHGRAIVTATGMATEMGRIAGLLKATTDEPTPLQRELVRTGRLLGGAVIAIALVMIVTIVLVENVRRVEDLFDVLILGVALAVAAVPEGLPAVVTAVLAMGVQRMARRNAIVRHLSAVETLGSASVIASDKTGTLTKNEMTVRAVVTASGRVTFDGSGYDPAGHLRYEPDNAAEEDLRVELRRALVIADRANNASLEQQDGRWVVIGDPMEGALLAAARKAGVDGADDRLPRTDEIPFSSERKLMSTRHDDARDGANLLFTKGAPDVLLDRCSHQLRGREERPLTSDQRARIAAASEVLAGQALRTLGVAYRRLSTDDGETPAGAELEQDLVFVGIVGIIDPPRAEAREAVTRARDAGVRVLMLTGDHPRTAAVIARELGIVQGDDRVLTGAELDTLPPAELAGAVASASVYARVNPEHKLRIIDALRQTGNVVAMTGDGVNDAPALKKADIGIAMGITGTDVSKEAADIVLVDDNFASIVAAVEDGRAIFANIRKFLRYLLSSNIGEVLTMFFGVLLAGYLGLETETDAVVLPLLATQILWINLVTDGPPALALGLDPPDDDLMQLPPRPSHEPVITASMWRGIAFVGLVMAAGTLTVLDASTPGGLIEGSGDLRYGQTMAFTTLMLFQIFNVVNARSDTRSAFRQLFTNAWLWVAIGGSLFLQVLVVYVPFLQRAFGTTALGAREWLTCAAVASSVLWLREATKIFARLRARQNDLRPAAH